MKLIEVNLSKDFVFTHVRRTVARCSLRKKTVADYIHFLTIQSTDCLDEILSCRIGMRSNHYRFGIAIPRPTMA